MPCVHPVADWCACLVYILLLTGVHALCTSCRRLVCMPCVHPVADWCACLVYILSLTGVHALCTSCRRLVCMSCVHPVADWCACLVYILSPTGVHALCTSCRRLVCMLCEQCLKCSKLVSNNHRAIFCYVCQSRAHLRCTVLNNNDYKLLANDGSDLYCSRCMSEVFF